eukprot:1137480-Pelagomonas_calceolata.AAC.5
MWEHSEDLVHYAIRVCSPFVIWDWRVKGSGTGSDFKPVPRLSWFLCSSFNGMGLPGRLSFNSASSRGTKGL